MGMASICNAVAWPTHLPYPRELSDKYFWPWEQLSLQFYAYQVASRDQMYKDLCMSKQLKSRPQPCPQPRLNAHAKKLGSFAWLI